MPVPEARGLHGEFGLREAIGHCDLPAAHVEKDDLPSVVSRLEGVIGQQVERWTTVSRSGWVTEQKYKPVLR
jgi:hypothetical protein